MKCPLSYNDINPQELKLMKLSCIGDSGLKKHTSTIHKCWDNLGYVVAGTFVTL